MSPARWPRDRPSEARVLRVARDHDGLEERRSDSLAQWFVSGDLLVINDAATLPASLSARAADGAFIELRLASAPSPDGLCSAITFGDGDPLRTPTERRAPPPSLRLGDTVTALHTDLSATVVSVDRSHDRLISVRFDRSGDALLRALYEGARPVQYAYIRDALSLWHVQTAFASRAWAVEAPSSGYLLCWSTLLEARSRGVQIATLTHAAGLSSTGDPSLDARLPLPERYEIPLQTAEAIANARSRGSRVIAVGTTVVRALEHSAHAHDGVVTAGESVADTLVNEERPPRVVDGVLTGVHEPGTSHFAMLTGFAPKERLQRAYEEELSRGFLAHEFGDGTMVL